MPRDERDRRKRTGCLSPPDRDGSHSLLRPSSDLGAPAYSAFENMLQVVPNNFLLPAGQILSEYSPVLADRMLGEAREQSISLDTAKSFGTPPFIAELIRDLP